MATIFEHKELAATETPLLIFDCELPAGGIERWSTHPIQVDGKEYQGRLLHHNLFEIRTASDQGVDAIPRVTVTLGNADSRYSQIERTVGWKGGLLTVRFLFYDLSGNLPASESQVVFKGILNPPEEITEATFRITAVNRMSLQRVLLPEVRIQRRCPWDFPSTPGQRLEAVDGGAKATYSRFYRCGYSPDQGGPGNLNNGEPFVMCGKTRSDCEARGMFRKDQAQRSTARFGGIEYVPASVLVRSTGEKGSHTSALAINQTRYNDFVPLIYGINWHYPLIVFARNDGNLTRMEVLVGLSEIEQVIRVLVNDVEIPAGQAGRNMTGTGWYNVVSHGGRNGGFNLDFADGTGSPLGDPYGSMAFLSIVTPNRINDGRTLPRVKVLVQGMKLPRYASDGSHVDTAYSNNPAWIVLDVLRRSGWRTDEIDLASFAISATYCEERIPTYDLQGNLTQRPRFQSNLVLRTRRSAADVVRGIRNGSRLFLTYGDDGKLRLRPENTISLQQPAKPSGSNSSVILDGGWPAYEFGDGTNGTTGILRRENGEPAIRVWSRSTADTPNRFTVEFQDEFNDYQQDSLSLVDVDDVACTGQEITGPLTLLGIPNFSQAGRILKFHLDKSVYGNVYLDLETGIRGFGLQPGDIITVTYLKEGLLRQPFRVLRLAPATNFRTVRITAQIHSDQWYTDTIGDGQSGGFARHPAAGPGLPRPLTGPVSDANGLNQFEVEEVSIGEGDGGASVELRVAYNVPATELSPEAGVPLLSLAATISPGGSLRGDQTLYYAVSAVDSNGVEGGLSFVVRAILPAGDEWQVNLCDLRFSEAATSFHVYRGSSPSQLFQIASNVPRNAVFIDSGLPAGVTGPPDPNFEHANFYWRVELQPEYPATIHSSTTIGNDSLQMVPSEFVGMLIHILRGTGAGQQRRISGNSATVLSMERAWDLPPDASSFFVIAEPAWHFGASATSSPVQFRIPNRTGAVFHVTGRSANVRDEEPPESLAVVTRWVSAGAGALGVDREVPPTPNFGLALGAKGGVVEIGGLSFPTLMNTRTIAAATATIHYWDELSGQTPGHLCQGTDDQQAEIELDAGIGIAAGSLVQVETEVVRVISADGPQMTVERGALGTSRSSHLAGAYVYPLNRSTVVMPFGKDFFGSAASGSWSFPVLLPDARVVAVELFVTNSAGNSPVAVVPVTQTIDWGLRTLSGGQYALTVGGFLAVETGATPEVIVDNPHSIRDIFAIVGKPPLDAPVAVEVTQGGTLLCQLTIPPGALSSASVSGFGLSPLTAGSRLGLNIISVGTTAPGSDLTVVIRL